MKQKVNFVHHKIILQDDYWCCHYYKAYTDPYRVMKKSNFTAVMNKQTHVRTLTAVCMYIHVKC